MTDMKAKFQRARVLVVGDAMLDRYWFGSVERISPEAPVPIVRVGREEERLGGAANVALNIKSLGAQASLMTVVGTDEPAGKLRKLLAEHGVKSLLGNDAKLNTIVKLRVIGRSQQLIRLDFESQPDHEVLALMLNEYQRVLPEHDAVLFSDYGKGGLTHIPRMIALAREAGKPVLIDPKGNDYGRYAGATVITPNREELAQVIGPWSSEAQLHERAQQLRQAQGFTAILLTRSGEGISLFDAQGHVQVPAMAREVFDVTGAGDTVIAVLSVLLACGVPLREALPVVNRAGGVVVGKFGAASLSYEELFP
ncbi:MAG TPA: D-glycero-beta-D-manno-heptose-7-phosphate kinase [Steroidobacteraceae bacterium]|jgi:rfaE bifunctional protein kinase chain/domain|nr:D-glycero-beta-D-manno-heptose-7-phosphate kinase [Steroidobacteraceae bacterium]